MKFLYRFNKQRFIKNSIWQGFILCSPGYGEAIAIRYVFDGEVRVYVYDQFKEFYETIRNRKDTSEITGVRDYLGNVSFVEFDDLLSDIRQNTGEFFSLREEQCRLQETCEREDAAGTLQDDTLVYEINEFWDKALEQYITTKKELSKML